MKEDYPHLPEGYEPGPQSERNRLGLGLTWWFVGIVGFAMFQGGVFVAAGGRGARFGFVEELLGGSLFIVIGAFCAGVAYWKYRSHRPIPLENFVRVALSVETDEARRGNAVSATITRPAKGNLQLGLVCEERYDILATSAGKHGVTRTRLTDVSPTYEDWRDLAPNAGEEVVTFEIPAEGPCSYEGECLSYSWRVSARLVRRRFGDPRLDRPIWVRP